MRTFRALSRAFADSVFVGAGGKLDVWDVVLWLQDLLNSSTTDERFRNAGSVVRRAGARRG
jgi:hypothetical protein